MYTQGRETAPLKPMTRADRHNNPAAFTTAIASNAKLILGVDYSVGDSFTDNGITYYTAKLLGDPLAITVRVINALGFRTAAGAWRWEYVRMPNFVWYGFTPDQKRDFIGYMYFNEGGTELRSLFPNYGKS